MYTRFGFSRSEIVSHNYILGFKQLTEIAIKAMSPGINDPGTAITCIDYLSELFALRLKKKDFSFIKNHIFRATSIVIFFVSRSLRLWNKLYSGR